jgi:hypothetical protein
MKSLLLLTILISSFHAVFAQSDTLKSYTTAWVKGEAPHIDGKLDDAAWNVVEWSGGDFRQINPDKGKPASVQTKFKIIYDAKNLYVGIRCLDPEPDKIARRMSRRDSFEGDMVEINIDSYNDKRTAFSFTASVSGVKGDEYVSNNGDNWDSGWDPIWYLKTSVDAEGWVAEFRIPLSQLRFANQAELTWGLQITRIFFRKQERSVWQYIPPDAAGWVHLFGSMKGINGIHPQKQLEIQPYSVVKTETMQKEEGNPYQTGSSNGSNFGLDAKVGITSDITLDLSVNPDFGQVEADPSQVNLTAFELFFQERRPFFIEGNNILNYSVGFNNNNLFYSRRIGRPPQTAANPDEKGEDNVNEYVKPIGRTTILGAAKLTGKNKKGFSWGLLESVTQKEFAEIDSLGIKRKQAIEPMTNYFVSRAQQDINKGNTIIGGIFTATNRRLDNARLDWLHKSAYSGGVDFLHHWKKRMYYTSGKAFFSYVAGSKDAISLTQLSSERYFQRPDNYHEEYNPNRTSLTGSGGQFMIGKKSGTIVSDLGLIWQSPMLEINDIGYMAQTDYISQWFWMQYRILQPKGITRYQRYNINQWRDFDFGRRNIGAGYNVNAHAQWKNYWNTGGGITYQVFSISNADLRGGPSMRYPGSMDYWWYINSDYRKKLYAEAYFDLFRGLENYQNNNSYNLDLTYRPMNALKITVSSSFAKNMNQLQYVATTDDASGSSHYVVGKIDQVVARVSLRMTYMVTPNISIQYWGQPFGSSGRYSNFKTITDSRASEYTQRFNHIPPSTLSLIDNEYHVADGNGMRDFSFGRPDFNFGQFRSNMVMRWEYIPGSTLFLVWTQESNGGFYDGQSPGHRSYSFDFPNRTHNIYLMKFTYRFRA